jgi:hypothetical protein
MMGNTFMLGAGERQDLTGNEGSFLRQQVFNATRDIVRTIQPPERRLGSFGENRIVGLRAVDTCGMKEGSTALIEMPLLASSGARRRTVCSIAALPSA